MNYTIMSLTEAAEFLHLEPPDVRALAVHGEIPCEHRGGDLVFRSGELKMWASRRILGLTGKHLHDYHSRGILHPHDLSPRAPLITELARPSACEPHLDGRTAPSVIKGMVTVAERTGLLYDPADLVDELRTRESLCSTAIDGGVALLHPRHHDPYMVEDSFICVGRTPSPVPFGAPDGGLTDLFFLVCCQEDRIHLHVLSRICLLCHGGALPKRLREAESPDDMFRAIAEEEQTVLAG